MAGTSFSLRHARIVVIGALVALVACAALCAAAILVPAPGAAVPAIVLACIGCPLAAAWDLPLAVRTLTEKRRARTKAVAALRRSLAKLPETEHPLGL